MCWCYILVNKPKQANKQFGQSGILMNPVRQSDRQTDRASCLCAAVISPVSACCLKARGCGPTEQYLRWLWRCGAGVAEQTTEPANPAYNLLPKLAGGSLKQDWGRWQRVAHSQHEAPRWRLAATTQPCYSSGDPEVLIMTICSHTDNPPEKNFPSSGENKFNGRLCLNLYILLQPLPFLLLSWRPLNFLHHAGQMDVYPLTDFFFFVSKGSSNESQTGSLNNHFIVLQNSKQQ